MEKYNGGTMDNKSMANSQSVFASRRIYWKVFSPRYRLQRNHQFYDELQTLRQQVFFSNFYRKTQSSVSTDYGARYW
ncbi:hypothetical protein DPMN_139650 [Dreissena polymorpha]|uniref:Uncharacterized protein n=1 Tax=Dreissena polymorpha TaxID=45954 RepID=A0A9D4G9I1_DREPO|nr:hypothetical protein DPMN_139650 [Dreissena polymorpha]